MDRRPELLLLAALTLFFTAAAGCGVATLEVHEEDKDISEQGDPEGGDRFTPFSTNLPKGAAVEVVKVKVGLNCRTGPSTSYMVVRLLANGERGTVLDYNSSKTWYKLDVGGVQCWSYHYYLAKVSDSGTNNGQGVGSGGDVGSSLGNYWHTYYYLAQQSDYPGSGYPIYDKSCGVIVSSTSAFYAAAKMEGSAKLNDGRVINYAGSCTCGGQSRKCFQVLSTAFPYGAGASGKAIIPLRSIAVDKSLIPLGSAIYIAEWDGKAMPSIDGLGGFTHDGCFRADDTGGAINGQHYDFFAGSKAMWQALENLRPTQSSSAVSIGGAKCAYVSSLTPTAPQTPNSPPGPSNGSCQGYCGQEAPGGCYCDDQCATFGDCCADKQTLCDGGSNNGGSNNGSNSTPPPASNPNGWSGMPAPFVLSRDGIINAASTYVGFSYWWGGAKLPDPWQASGASKGSCSSPSFSGHSGTYGADCSGFVGDVWQLPEHQSFSANQHPFSTYHFYHQENHWTKINRATAQRGDALVYRSSSGGHIVVFESVDPWGKVWTYEARGCSYGIKHNLRTLGTAYKARQRHGLL
ncbi:MAG: hypothetical protein CSB49_08240 [Proteobacteria bacterium]|nr:MAG: hypothetical protein CSB49_08240 [Pseudomonadota bacterium]